MNITKTLAQELSLNLRHVEAAVGLLDEDNTVPFIARYRKELTGSMDDQVLRNLNDRLQYLRSLEANKAQVAALLTEQGNYTPELSAKLQSAATLTEIEDIYRPFRPKRRTRATIAEEKGLGPLAELIFLQQLYDLEAAAAEYVDTEKGVADVAEALAGAADILAERISDDPQSRAAARRLTWEEGLISSVLSKSQKSGSAKKADKAEIYEMYFEFSEPLKKLPGHRTLAINRGEKEDVLKVTVEAPSEKILHALCGLFVKDNPATKAFMEETAADSYKRLIAPGAEREIRNSLTEQAEEGAIKVFGENLRQLLMQPPVKGRVLAVDPGFRTGCKLAVIDDMGKVLETGIIYAAINSDRSRSKEKLADMLTRHKADIIAIGNGTASRETELVVAELIGELKTQTAKYTIVNEAGASVYSASKLGAEEFPDFDVSLRSAVSIGRRLQDPLAELVKIDPKSIGIGQYQHDMNQKRLTETLAGVVETCVNAVGVDLNTASPSLLAYVAGLSSAVCKNILEYREENGRFKSRRELLKVKKLGPKAFEQCAGFLRIPGGENPLDNTAVHPESYKVAEKLLGLADEQPGNLEETAAKLNVGMPTLRDILTELKKPGRDIRDEAPPVLLRSDVLSAEDLTEGMVLTGTVRNVLDFGAFVDIGVHQDGLVHISKICDRYIKHPLEAVKVGDVVKVMVMGVDLKKKRISLSIRDAVKG